MEPKPLIADIVIGPDLRHCLVLASHPDERMEPDGDPSRTRRTIVLRFDGERFSAPSTLPVPLDRGWASANGAGYCTSFRGSLAHVYVDGQWGSERFSSQDEDVLRIWGISGGTPQEDRVYVSTEGTLFIRQAGAWSRHVPPEPAKRLFGVHGLRPEELYVCSDTGLLLWNGQQFQPLEDRPVSIVEAILVHGDEIYAGNRFLVHWTKATGWQRWQPTLVSPTAIIDIDDAIIVSTFKHGVTERNGGQFVSVTPPHMALELQRIGDGAFAMGDDQSYIRLDGRWQRLVMPGCVVGQLPDGIR